MATTDYYQGFNRALFDLVSEDAMSILEVGCSAGHLGAALKQANPGRYVAGIEYVPEVAAQARQRLDAVHVMNLESDDLPPDLSSRRFDRILFGDVLEHLRNPTAVLKRLSHLLKPDGLVLTSIPNVQHVSVIAQLLTQNFQYHDSGLLDRTHVHLFSLSNIQKMFLDAGMVPLLARNTADPNVLQHPLVQALQPALTVLGIHPKHAAMMFGTFQYLFAGVPRQRPPVAAVQPCSVVCAINNEVQFNNNLRASPDLTGSNSVHQIVEVRQATSIADAFTKAIPHCASDWVILAHQDVYLPEGWFARLQTEWVAYEARLGVSLGVAGVMGLSPISDGESIAVGTELTGSKTVFSTQCGRVDTLDEQVLVFRKSRFIPQLDPGLGFHMYGAEACVQAKMAGHDAAVLPHIECLHNTSRYSSAGEDPTFIAAVKRFMTLYRAHLPLCTTCTFMDADGTARVF